MTNKNTVQFIANCTAKACGSNRATEVRLVGPLTIQQCAVRGQLDKLAPRVVLYDGPHAESRTGIRASLAALKRFWSTYHYVAAKCVVEVPDRDAIYSDDSH